MNNKVIKLSPQDEILTTRGTSPLDTPTIFHQMLTEAEIKFLKKCICDEIDWAQRRMGYERQEAISVGVLIGLAAGIIGMGFYITLTL